MGKLWKSFVDWLLDEEPIFASRPSEAYTEGWKFALEQEKARTRLAESKLEAIDSLADGIIEYNRCPQYGRDIKAILKMTQEQLDSDGVDVV